MRGSSTRKKKGKKKRESATESLAVILPSDFTGSEIGRIRRKGMNFLCFCLLKSLYLFCFGIVLFIVVLSRSIKFRKS